jgi:hypothetical protein
MKNQFADLRRYLGTAQLVHHGSKVLLVPFFIVHYGLFCFVHGTFIFAIFEHEGGGFGPFGGFQNLKYVFTEQHLWWGVVALAGSHLYSFFANFIGHGEYRRTAAPLLMFQPYSRIVVLHIAILFGAFITLALGSNIGVLAILIVGKTLLDLSLHVREHDKFSKSDPESAPILPEVILREAGQTHSTPSATEP